MKSLESTDLSSDNLFVNSTKAKKEVWIESDCLGLRSAIKKFGVDRFKKNCAAATEGFEFVLQNKIHNASNVECQSNTKNSTFDTTQQIKPSISSSIYVTTGTKFKSCYN